MLNVFERAGMCECLYGLQCVKVFIFNVYKNRPEVLRFMWRLKVADEQYLKNSILKLPQISSLYSKKEQETTAFTVTKTTTW